MSSLRISLAWAGMHGHIVGSPVYSCLVCMGYFPMLRESNYAGYQMHQIWCIPTGLEPPARSISCGSCWWFKTSWCARAPPTLVYITHSGSVLMCSATVLLSKSHARGTQWSVVSAEKCGHLILFWQCSFQKRYQNSHLALEEHLLKKRPLARDGRTNFGISLVSFERDTVQRK